MNFKNVVESMQDRLAESNIKALFDEKKKIIGTGAVVAALGIACGSTLIGNLNKDESTGRTISVADLETSQAALADNSFEVVAYTYADMQDLNKEAEQYAKFDMIQNSQEELLAANEGYEVSYSSVSIKEEKKAAEEAAKAAQAKKAAQAQQVAAAGGGAPSYVQPSGGGVLTAAKGVNYNAQGTKETYYNLNMKGVINIAKNQGIQGEYWVRGDGVKMYGDYVIVAADLNQHPRGSTVETSLGTGIVLDTGSFIYSNSNQIDIATAW